MAYDLKPWQKMALAGGIVAAIAGYCGKERREYKETARAVANAPAIPDYKEIVKEIDYAAVPRLAQQNSIIGRIQRTQRWEPLIDAVEERYGMPDGLLAAVVMNESYGNPVMPNATGDGGLGLVHFQPPTARRYGLDVHGRTNGRSRDKINGAEITKIIKECENSVPCIAGYDDRAHLLRNLDATARLIADGKASHGSWDGGIRDINWWGPQYVQRIKEFQAAYNNKTWNRKAEQDFEERNKMSYEKYLKNSHDRMVNWGLDAYEANDAEYQARKHGNHRKKIKNKRR